jgi:hypothetical protein
MLTPKIGTGKRLTCGPSLVRKHHSAGIFLKAFGKDACGREHAIIRQKGCFALERGSIREYVMIGVLGVAVELALVVHDHVEVTFEEGGGSWRRLRHIACATWCLYRRDLLH